MKIRIESNYNASLIRNELSLIEPKWQIDDGGYNLVSESILDTDSSLYTKNYDILILMLDTEFLSSLSLFRDPFGCSLTDEYNKIEEAVESIFLLIDSYHNIKPDTAVCLFNFSLQANTAFNYLETNSVKHSINKVIFLLNSAISERANSKAYVFIFDINKIILNHGYKNIVDMRLWYLTKSPYSQDGLKYITEELKPFLSRIYTPHKKVLVIDLDNTIWSGIVGEDGAHGIEITNDGYSKAFYDFQLEIKNLYKRGVLLAICSKNNESDVKEAFDAHPEMPLQWEDFIVKKINWENKSDNIIAIARDLDLATDSFVFIDDNPSERLLVKSQLPEVYVTDFPDDCSELKDFILSLNVFNTFHLTDEDFNKSNSYKLEQTRKQSRVEGMTYQQYLLSLDLSCSFNIVTKHDIKRVSQLCGKTNQFNFTTHRYTEAELEIIIKDQNITAFSLSASDRFGDYGIVGVAILQKHNETAVLESFLMSCRVLGKKIEDFFLASIARYAANTWNCRQMEGLYKPTVKNIQLEDYYPEHGFEFIIFKNGVKHYMNKNLQIDFPEHIRFENGI